MIGGGLLGLEAARGLLNHGCDVHVVHLAPHLMEQQLDTAGGAILESAIEKMGITVHLGKATTEVLGDGSGRRARVQGRRPRSIATCVVISAGIRPNAETRGQRRTDG